MSYRLDAALTLEQMGIISQRLIDELEELGVDEDKVIDEANKAINSWNSYFQDNITIGKRDIKFLMRDQWEANERGEFNRLFKVCLTYNTIGDIVNKIIGEQRKMRPALMVRSINGLASDEELDLRTDLLRSISYHSGNDIVYQTAFSSAMKFSYGAFQIYSEYESPNSFRQVIKYDIVEDPTTVFFDPRAKMPHKGDGDFCGRLFTMGIDESKAKYPWIEHPESFANPQTMNTRLFKMKDTVVFCDYFQKEWYSKIIYELDNEKVVDEDEWKEIEQEFKDITKEMGEKSSANIIIMRDKPRIVAERQTEDFRIMHYRLLKNRIVEVSEFPSKHLPIVFVSGRSCYIEGKQYVKSYINDAKDMQKFANYVISEIATEVKNRRREQWLVTPDNIVGNEAQWRNPEISYAALKAKPDPKTGAMPQKLPPSEMPQTLLASLASTVGGIKEILGYYDANLGKPSNEKSGVAIENRATQGNLAAFEYFDNMNQAIAQGGRVVVSMMPYIYGDKRSIVISNEAGESRNIVINKENKDGSVENPILEGEYDIEISAAPSFAVQKAQSLDILIKLASTNPQIFPLVADLVAKNLDVEDQHRIIKRFEKLVPPGILAEEKGEEPPPPQPSPQEQMMEMQKEIQMKQLEERAEELKIRQEKHELEKVKLAMDAREMQEKLEDGKHKRATELHKADLDFTAKIASVLKDLHK